MRFSLEPEREQGGAQGRFSPEDVETCLGIGSGSSGMPSSDESEVPQWSISSRISSCPEN